MKMHGFFILDVMVVMSESQLPLAHDVSDPIIKRTRDVASFHDGNFDSLLLSENILRGLIDAGFATPSPIQLKSIPIGRCGLGMSSSCLYIINEIFAVIAVSGLLWIIYEYFDFCIYIFHALYIYLCCMYFFIV